MPKRTGKESLPKGSVGTTKKGTFFHIEEGHDTRLKAYCELFGSSREFVLNEALDFWLKRVAKVRMEQAAKEHDGVELLEPLLPGKPEEPQQGVGVQC